MDTHTRRMRGVENTVSKKDQAKSVLALFRRDKGAMDFYSTQVKDRAIRTGG